MSDEESEKNYFQRQTVVIALGNDTKDIAQEYAKKQESDFIYTNEFQNVLFNLRYSKYKKFIIFSHSSRLSLEPLKQISKLNKCIAIITGVSTTELNKLIKKNSLYKKNRNHKQIYCMTENYSTVKENIIFSDFRKEVHTNQLYANKLTYLLGGGTVYEVRLGNNFVLGAKQTFTKTKMLKSPRKELSIDEIDTDTLLINGCVAGVICPTKYESKKGKDPLSLRIMNAQKINTYIAPFEVKAAIADEGILATWLIQNNLSSAQTAQILNEYLIYNNSNASYACYGDDGVPYQDVSNVFYTSTFDGEAYSFQKSCYIGLIDDFDSSQYCLVSDSDINYFSIDLDGKKSYVVFSKNNLINKKIFLKKKIRADQFESAKEFIDSVKANSEVAKVIPEEVQKQIKLLSSIQGTLEKEFPLYLRNTRINLKLNRNFKKLISLQQGISETIGKYWLNNTRKDSLRIYDLHYGSRVLSVINESVAICPVCGQQQVKEMLSKSLFGHFNRVLLRCPSCSIISDFQDTSLSIKISSTQYKEYIEGNIVIKDKLKSIINCLYFLSIRGIDQKVDWTITNLNRHLAILKYRFSKKKDLPADEKYYLSTFILRNGKLNYYKKTI